MDINSQDVITSTGTAVGGGGVRLAAAAWLSKQIVTHKLAQASRSLRRDCKHSARAEHATSSCKRGALTG